MARSFNKETKTTKIHQNLLEKEKELEIDTRKKAICCQLKTSRMIILSVLSTHTNATNVQIKFCCLFTQESPKMFTCFLFVAHFFQTTKYCYSKFSVLLCIYFTKLFKYLHIDLCLWKSLLGITFSFFSILINIIHSKQVTQ